MYSLSEQQIGFIRDDLFARGIRMEELRLSLLDHICILIEQGLEEDGNFEEFYAATLATFYNDELCEIENETLFLLTGKNHHSMKKAMIISGSFSVAASLSGCFSKIMHLRLADFLLFIGFSSFVFLFLPLMFIVRIKETDNRQDRLILISGTIAGVLYFFCMLLKFLGPGWPPFLGQRWANLDMIWLTLWLIALAIGLFVFIPAYFFKGIGRPETRMNTIIISVLLIVFASVQFTFTNLRPRGMQPSHASVQGGQAPGPSSHKTNNYRVALR